MRLTVFPLFLLSLTAGCAVLRTPVTQPSAAACVAWSTTRDAFRLSAAALEAELEQRRSDACQAPPADSGPAEPTPPAPDSAPGQVPLPKQLRREEEQ